jgi:hypothetical protein
MNRDVILAALQGYRCQYTRDEDGNGIDLVDLLSPFTCDIKEGRLELELLADHIDTTLTDLDRYP